MSSWINIPIEEIDQAFLADLKKRVAAGSRVELRVVEPSGKPALAEDAFWQIIAQLDWSAESVIEVIRPAVEVLAARSVAEIFLFEDLLAEKLQALDTPRHARAVYSDEDHISVDGFLYVRAAVVAQGKAVFEKVLQDPGAIDPDQDFEPLLSLAAKAYERKTGKPFDYHSHIAYGTFGNW